MRLERIEPKVHQSDGAGSKMISTDVKSVNVNHKRSSPRTKSTPRESTLFGGKFLFLLFLFFSLETFELQC